MMVCFNIKKRKTLDFKGFPLYMRDSVLYPNLIFFENYTTFAYVVNL